MSIKPCPKCGSPLRISRKDGVLIAYCSNLPNNICDFQETCISPLNWVKNNCRGCRHLKEGFCYILTEMNIETRKKCTTIAVRYIKNFEEHCGLRNKTIKVE